MKPSDLLVRALERWFAPVMAEHGFWFARSSQVFNRRRGPITHVVSFSLHRRNHEDSCRFWTIWGVRSSAYCKWHVETWGVPPPSDGLAGRAEWNIPGFSVPGAEPWWLRNSREDRGMFEQFAQRALQYGLPYLERLSTWESIAEEAYAKELRWSLAADLFFMADAPGRALEVIGQGIERLSAPGVVDQLGELPLLRARMERYAP